MRTLLIAVALIGAIIAGLLWLPILFPNLQDIFLGQPVEQDTQGEQAVATSTVQSDEHSGWEIVAENLEIPWGIAFLPDDGMLVTERPGRVVHIESGRTFPVPGVKHIGEGGLLGIALPPDFAENRFVYLYQTTETSEGIENQIVRYRYTDDALAGREVVFDGIPGAQYHDGGRIAFGPGGLLWVTVGDATDENEAQNNRSLHGSILRINPDGTTPEDNPFGNAVYSYGHRNPQGLTWDAQNRLWSTEHGRSGIRSGFDELNLITAGKNYGWPESQGDEVAEGTVAPAVHSGADTTWAPASAQYWDGSIFWGGLRGAALYEAVLSGQKVTEVREHFKGEFGRIRTVTLGPDGMLYLTTSNRDGRGRTHEGDDKIIRLDPRQFR